MCRWPYLADSIESVSLFKNHIWNDIWCLNQREEPDCRRLGSKIVQHQNLGEICYPTFRAKYGGSKAPPKVGTHLPDYTVS